MPFANKYVTSALALALPFAAAGCSDFSNKEPVVEVIKVSSDVASCSKTAPIVYEVNSKADKVNIATLFAEGNLDGSVTWKTDKEANANVDVKNGTCSVDQKWIIDGDRVTKRFTYNME